MSSRIPPRARLVMGIDAGLEGAIAVLSQSSGALHSWHLMPTRVNARQKRVIDVKALWVILARYEGRVARVVTEYQHSYGSEARSRLFHFGKGCGRMEAVVELCLEGVPFYDVTPQVWKEAVLGNMSTNKKETVKWAQATYPKAHLPSKDGVADALGQAVYGVKFIK